MVERLGTQENPIVIDDEDTSRMGGNGQTNGLRRAEKRKWIEKDDDPIIEHNCSTRSAPQSLCERSFASSPELGHNPQRTDEDGESKIAPSSVPQIALSETQIALKKVARNNRYNSRQLKINKQLIDLSKDGKAELSFGDQGIRGEEHCISRIKSQHWGEVIDRLNACISGQGNKAGTPSENLTQCLRDCGVVPRKCGKGNHSWKAPQDGVWEFSSFAMKVRKDRLSKQYAKKPSKEHQSRNLKTQTERILIDHKTANQSEDPSAEETEDDEFVEQTKQSRDHGEDGQKGPSTAQDGDEGHMQSHRSFAVVSPSCLSQFGVTAPVSGTSGPSVPALCRPLAVGLPARQLDENANEDSKPKSEPRSQPDSFGTKLAAVAANPLSAKATNVSQESLLETSPQVDNATDAVRSRRERETNGRTTNTPALRPTKRTKTEAPTPAPIPEVVAKEQRDKRAKVAILPDPATFASVSPSPMLPHPAPNALADKVAPKTPHVTAGKRGVRPRPVFGECWQFQRGCMGKAEAYASFGEGLGECDDALTIRKERLGVFDGVGEGRMRSGLWARTLANEIGADQGDDTHTQQEEKGHASLDVLRRVYARAVSAYEKQYQAWTERARHAPGSAPSTTAVILSLSAQEKGLAAYTNECGGRLDALVEGDSQWALLRRGEDGTFKLRHLSLPQLLPPRQPGQLPIPHQIGLRASSFEHYMRPKLESLAVQDGDIVVVGTDGFFDNFHDGFRISDPRWMVAALEEHCNQALRASRPQSPHLVDRKSTGDGHPSSRGSFVQRFGTSLKDFAVKMMDRRAVGSKQDDITLVVAMVTLEPTQA